MATAEWPRLSGTAERLSVRMGQVMEQFSPTGYRQARVGTAPDNERC
ncbi:hypothetical protein ABH941_003784 [Streptacidiphilus sp. EB103A]